jgi:hypothetical protein
VSTPEEGSWPLPGHTERDSHEVTDLFTAYANALETGEAEDVRRIGAALAEAAARAGPDAADEPESGA